VNIRFLIALAAILFSALPSSAQTNEGWDARFFPTTNASVRVYDSSNVVYASDVIISQMIYAVNERWVIANRFSESQNQQTWETYQFFALNYPIYVRRPEQALANVKDGLKRILSVYVKSYNETNFLPDTVEYYNSTNILTETGLPPDFFDVIPVRNLMGNSSFSTNAADYGWDGAYRIINKLTNTLAAGSFAKYERRGSCDLSGAGLSSSLIGGIQFFSPPQISENYSIFENRTIWLSPETIRKNDLLFDFGKKTYQGMRENIYELFPYLLTNATAKTFQTEFSGFQVYPDPQNFPGSIFIQCPPDYGYALPNQGVVDTYTEICTSNTVWRQGESLTFFEPLFNSGIVYPLPQQFAAPATLICGAAQILADIECYANFEEFDSTIITACDGVTDIYAGAATSASASTETTIQFVNIVSWGFQYK
jgi:hypothetical protein